MLPSWTWSSTPVTVTVRATFQFAAVNVRLGAETVPSAGLPVARRGAAAPGGGRSPGTRHAGGEAGGQQCPPGRVVAHAGDPHVRQRLAAQRHRDVRGPAPPGAAG